VGNNPTFDGVPERQVEAHVLDRDLDLYGKSVEVSFVSRIRGMEKFDGVDALVEQIGYDVSQVRALLLGGAGR
jgi:riboflavin kinase/FMN adenylyltransferase